MKHVLDEIFKEELNCREVSLRQEGFSSLNAFQIYETDYGDFFVKLNRASGLNMLEAEAKGLQLIAKTKTLRVPRPVKTGVFNNQAYLIMEHLQLTSHTRSSQEALGRQLAQMHFCTGPKKFGLDHDNTIGLTPQINTWTDSWIDFYRTYRLGYQLEQIDKKYDDVELLKVSESYLDRLPSFLEELEILPSLLHGDLWGGNAASLAEGTPVVYDPACYYGHHEADLSMTNMFGGFSPHFYGAYHELIPKASGFEQRNALYQLYHYLNHYLLFGSSYSASCLAILGGLGSV